MCKGVCKVCKVCKVCEVCEGSARCQGRTPHPQTSTRVAARLPDCQGDGQGEGVTPCVAAVHLER